MSRSRKMWLVLALALACGATAAVLAARYIQESTRPLLASTSGTREVAVAAVDIPVGELLRPEQVRLVRWPDEAVPVGYYSSVDQVVGRGLTTPVRANEPLMAGKLAGEGEGAGLPVLIPDGMRAVSVSVSNVVAVAGFVIPGSRVDVLLTIRRENNEPQTRVFMQNMMVLASNQTLVQDEEGKPMQVGIVTLLVTPEQAEKLTLATQEGQIHLALRNRVDVDDVETRGARRADLGGAVSAPASRRVVNVRARPAPRETVIETYRGGARTLSTFSNEAPR